MPIDPMNINCVVHCDDTVEVTGLDTRRVQLGGDDRLRKYRRQGCRGVVIKVEDRRDGSRWATVRHLDNTVAQYRPEELSPTPAWWKLVWRQDQEIRFREFRSKNDGLEFVGDELPPELFDSVVWEGPFFGERTELQSGVIPGRTAADVLESDEL